MADYILDLLNANETVDYSLILSFVAAYVVFMWFIVSIWLFTDAKKRYKSSLQPILFSLFTLLFGPPALIFYIMIRPEHTLDEDYYINMALSGEKQSRPIYFDGDKGFDINIDLSVQPKEAGGDDKHKMNVEVSWMPKDRSKIGNSKSINVKRSNIGRLKRRLKSLTEELANTVKSILNSNRRKPELKIEDETEMIKENEKEEEDISAKIDIKKKKKKNRRKKKKKKRKK